ncbi:MAG: hypothetical protein ABSA92_13170 [Candidatus Bathyarchaeia archaeon]|jgi:hypothetical protein
MREKQVRSIIVLVLTMLVVVASSSLVSASPSVVQGQKWINPNANVISWTVAGQYVGQMETVDGTIVSTYVSAKGNVFLDFNIPWQGYFYGVIFSNDVGNFRCSPSGFYLNQEVRITGLIQSYKGSPEIIVNSPSQIEVAYQGFACS